MRKFAAKHQSHFALRMPVALIAGALAVAGASACAGGDADRCDLATDCASGFCRADHTCAPVDETDGGLDGATSPDAAGGCQPDHDGTVTIDELPMMAGQTAQFRIATDVTVDTAGVQGPGGERTWTLAAALPGDQDTATALVAPAGTWWAASFPTASYAARLSIDSDLLGVMRKDASGVALIGVVSPEAGVTRTELAYDPVVPLIPTPLTASSTWSTTATVSGLASGITSFYTERYQSRVDAVGTLATPFGTFPVRRIATDLTRTVGIAVTTRRTFAFVAECYGTVATISSQDYETAAEFASAAEVWRLTP